MDPLSVAHLIYDDTENAIANVSIIPLNIEHYHTTTTSATTSTLLPSIFAAATAAAAAASSTTASAVANNISNSLHAIGAVETTTASSTRTTTVAAAAAIAATNSFTTYIIGAAGAAVTGSLANSNNSSGGGVGGVVGYNNITINGTGDNFNTTDINFEASSSPLPPIQAIIISVILLIVILGTIIGNILVCVAVCLVRKLRRPCNYLLVSLAVSDLCVAVLVMPTALLYEVLGKWKFGTVFCDIWVSFDVLSCTASILNLCAISVDRYWAITKPLEYGVKRTPRRMMLCVALVWLGAACISLPPLLILGNEHMDDTGTPVCTVCQNFGYQIYATLGAFYMPLSVMLFVYYQIFRAARRIVMDEKRAQTRLESTINGGTKNSHSEKTVLDGGVGTTGGSHIIGSPHQKKLRFQLAKERKASTTLGIIMSAFTICWLPFFILALLRPFLGENHSVPQTLSSLFLWLGYANSLLNPIIYATLNKDFRKPFQEILYFRCSSLNLMMREDFYHSQYGEPQSQRVVLGGEGHGARESFL